MRLWRALWGLGILLLLWLWLLLMLLELEIVVGRVDAAGGAPAAASWLEGADGEVTERTFAVEIAIAVDVAVGGEYSQAGLDAESEHAEVDEEVGEGDVKEEDE